MISLVCMVLSMAISLFGLTKIVVVGYGYVGIIGIFAVVIPCIVVGRIKNNRFKKEKESILKEENISNINEKNELQGENGKLNEEQDDMSTEYKDNSSMEDKGDVLKEKDSELKKEQDNTSSKDKDIVSEEGKDDVLKEEDSELIEGQDDISKKDNDSVSEGEDDISKENVPVERQDDTYIK